jgi:hypothetical protein
MPLTCDGIMRADDGNRTRMTSLEGVRRVAVRAAELGGSLSGGDRDRPLLTGVNGPLIARKGARFACIRIPLRAVADPTGPA